MIEEILEFDRRLFISINSGLTSDKFDFLMTMISEQWVAVILVILCMIYASFSKNWRLLKLIVSIIVIVLIADYFNYQVIKPFFNRLRPCKELSYDPRIVERLSDFYDVDQWEE